MNDQSDKNDFDTTYSPNGVVSRNSSRLPKPIHDLVEYHELVWRLILRNFSVRYRQSLLGYLWALIFPVAAITVFALLARYRILPMGKTTIPYVAFGIWSITVWQLFSSTLTACTNSLVHAGPMVKKFGFPKDVLVISSIGEPIFDFIIRLMPVVIVFVWFGVVPAWQSVFIPVLLVLLLALSIGLGFYLSIMNMVLRDIGNIVTMFATFGMFVAPVLYPPPVSWPFTLVNILNPVSPILITTQDLLASGSITHPKLFAWAIILSFSLLFSGWFFFRRTIYRVIEYA